MKELKEAGRPKMEIQEAVAQLKVRKKHLEAKVRARGVVRLGGAWLGREGVINLGGKGCGQIGREGCDQFGRERVWSGWEGGVWSG